MARFTRLEVAMKMGEQGMLPLFYDADIESCKRVVSACYRGGARLLEFTNRGDFAHEAFSALNKYCMSELPDLILGVGSVNDTGTAAIYLQCGANFIVTPVLREDVGLMCNRRKVLWAPGCGSLTEIARAEELGAEIVKLFPGSTYGPGFIKAVRGPQPWTSIMPTGGVSPDSENLKSWFDAGAYCVGMGSKLMARTASGEYDLGRIEVLTRESLDAIRTIRSL